MQIHSSTVTLCLIFFDLIFITIIIINCLRPFAIGVIFTVEVAYEPLSGPFVDAVSVIPDLEQNSWLLQSSIYNVI